MRIWSIHPKYLDSKGLVALWREGLLAQKVLQGKTKGYKNHPQLERFKNCKDPLLAIGDYLQEVFNEASKRGYFFNKSKIVKCGDLIIKRKIAISTGQKSYEMEHLKEKLKVRDPKRYKDLSKVKKIDLHPLFRGVRGTIASWEITN